MKNVQKVCLVSKVGYSVKKTLLPSSYAVIYQTLLVISFTLLVISFLCTFYRHSIMYDVTINIVCLYYVVSIKTTREISFIRTSLDQAQSYSKDECSALFPGYFDIMPNEKNKRFSLIFFYYLDTLRNAKLHGYNFFFFTSYSSVRYS